MAANESISGMITKTTQMLYDNLKTRYDSGFPILGDELYGGIKDSRIMLHSSLFEFIHPVTKEKIHIESKPDFLNQKCNFLSWFFRFDF